MDRIRDICSQESHLNVPINLFIREHPGYPGYPASRFQVTQRDVNVPINLFILNILDILDILLKKPNNAENV